MKKIVSIIMALILCLSMCACGNNGLNSTNNTEKPTTIPTTSRHTHDWKAASCTERKTCATCGKVEGSPKGHDWESATCTNPKTCKTCGATNGSANGHDWESATCTSPKICRLCNVTFGSALNHNFEGGDCQTLASCTNCGQKSSENADHSYYGGKCSVCGATNERYDEIKAALKSVERYPKYIKINYDLIDNEYELFKMTSNAKYFTDAHEHCLEVHEYLQKIIDKCEDYKELDMLTDECRDLLLEMPTVPTSASTSSMRSYISSARSYARKCKDVIIIYNVFADKYDLPNLEY